MLGCSFPDWLAQFFYCALKGEGMLIKGIRGLVADMEKVHDSNLCRFLKRGQTEAIRHVQIIVVEGYEWCASI